MKKKNFYLAFSLLCSFQGVQAMESFNEEVERKLVIAEEVQSEQNQEERAQQEDMREGAGDGLLQVNENDLQQHLAREIVDKVFQETREYPYFFWKGMRNEIEKQSDREIKRYMGKYLLEKYLSDGAYTLPLGDGRIRDAEKIMGKIETLGLTPEEMIEHIVKILDKKDSAECAKNANDILMKLRNIFFVNPHLKDELFHKCLLYTVNKITSSFKHNSLLLPVYYLILRFDDIAERIVRTYAYKEFDSISDSDEREKAIKQLVDEGGGLKVYKKYLKNWVPKKEIDSTLQALRQIISISYHLSLGDEKYEPSRFLQILKGLSGPEVL